MTEGIKKPTTRTALKSFTQLIKAGEAMFYSKGYFKTTINDIVEHAKVSTGTFYSYFESKYALYVYIMDKYEKELKRYLAQRTSSLKTRAEMEIEGIKAFIEHAYHNPTCYNLIWESLYIDKNLFYGYYNNFADSYIHGLEKHIDELKEVDLSSAAYILMGVSNFLGLKAICDGELTQEKLSVMAEAIRVILIEGLFKAKP